MQPVDCLNDGEPTVCIAGASRSMTRALMYVEVLFAQWDVAQWRNNNNAHFTGGIRN